MCCGGVEALKSKDNNVQEAGNKSTRSLLYNAHGGRVCSTEELRSRREGPKRRKPLEATPTERWPLEKHTHTHTHAAHTQPMMTHAAVQSTSNPTHIDRARPDDGSLCRLCRCRRPSTVDMLEGQLFSLIIARSGLAYATNCGRTPSRNSTSCRLPMASVCLWGLELQHNETMQRLGCETFTRRPATIDLMPTRTQHAHIKDGGVAPHCPSISGNRRSGRMSGNGS